MFASFTTPAVATPRQPVRWIAHVRAVQQALALRRMERHIGTLSPHQLRDIGLPEALSDITRGRMHPQIKEMIR
jgi:uncharacterized protein YjiS (DUF1127 family)